MSQKKAQFTVSRNLPALLVLEFTFLIYVSCINQSPGDRGQRCGHSVGKPQKCFIPHGYYQEGAFTVTQGPEGGICTHSSCVERNAFTSISLRDAAWNCLSLMTRFSHWKSEKARWPTDRVCWGTSGQGAEKDREWARGR